MPEVDSSPTMPTRTQTYEPARRPPEALTPQPHLVCVLSCDDLRASSWRHALGKVDFVRFGRERAYAAHREECELAIGLPDRHVSTAHAVLRREGSTFTLEDAGSKNGSFVNGRHETRATLADGDVVRIGRTVFIFRAALPSSSASTGDTQVRAHAPGLVTLLPDLALAFDRLVEIARSRATVLVLGETGTGKEIVAHAVRVLSNDPKTFIAVNCGAIAPALVESELFGHRRGAFTGAVAEHAGIFRAADGGTLFLDEVAELPAGAQASLLRVLQEGEVRPVGATSVVRVHVRVVSATHADLPSAVERGAFREDLLARLSGFTLRLPPLRERREDMGTILSALLHEQPTGASGAPPSMAPEAAERLLAYDWPRNIREFRAALVEAIAMARGGPILLEHLPEVVRTSPPGRTSPSNAEGLPLQPRVGDPGHREQLIEALRAHRGNVVRVAETLRTSRTQIHRWARRYGLTLEDYRE